MLHPLFAGIERMFENVNTITNNTENTETMQKVKVSTGKPLLNEMRYINGKVMIWDGKNWINEKEDRERQHLNESLKKQLKFPQTA